MTTAWWVFTASLIGVGVLGLVVSLVLFGVVLGRAHVAVEDPTDDPIGEHEGQQGSMGTTARRFTRWEP